MQVYVVYTEENYNIFDNPSEAKAWAAKSNQPSVIKLMTVGKPGEGITVYTDGEDVEKDQPATINNGVRCELGNVEEIRQFMKAPDADNLPVIEFSNSTISDVPLLHFTPFLGTAEWMTLAYPDFAEVVHVSSAKMKELCKDYPDLLAYVEWHEKQVS